MDVGLNYLIAAFVNPSRIGFTETPMCCRRATVNRHHDAIKNSLGPYKNGSDHIGFTNRAVS